ncbi:AMIN domain-containing protein [Corynebacterium sp. c8Ua_172]|uniref:AMIN domain-containing protein n=2 Tax=Corynebacterium meitnerae TaxID=2913498 RepID=A0A9X3LWK2_9CORY|nr:AMIN domain-containing protein [Corynebacterium meitnerae]
MEPEDLEPLGAMNSSPKTTRPAAPARLAVTDIEVNSYSDFDRVTLTMSGDGEPGWFADYVPSPVHGSTGQPVKVKGAAFLNVSIDGTVFPADVGAEASAPERVNGAGKSSPVAEVVNADTSGGRTQVVIGLNSRAPFSVVTVQDPTRVVIDIAR